MSATVAKILLGLDAEDMTASIESKEYCRVTLYNGGQFPNGDPYYVTYPLETNQETYYESGDLVRPRSQDTGDELVMDCAWLDSGTQGEAIGLQGKKIAKAVYNRIVGKQYNPFISNNAILNPLAEIGDGVLVNGHYAPIYRRVAYLDSLYTADIAAPYKEEEDEEYPYEAKSVTEFERIKKSIYGVRTSLTVTDGNINALVERLYDENDGDIVTLSASLNIEAGKIEQIVQSVGDDGEVTAASIVAAINGSGSNVTISADHIQLQGTTTFIATQSYADDAADDAVDDLVTELGNPYTSGTTIIDGGRIRTGQIDARYISTEIAQVNDYLSVGHGDMYGSIEIGFPRASGDVNYDLKLYADEGDSQTRPFGMLENWFDLRLQSQSGNLYLQTGDTSTGGKVIIINPSGSQWEIDGTGIFFRNVGGTISKQVVLQNV